MGRPTVSSNIHYERLLLRQRLLAKQPYCALCHVRKAEDLHEIVSRGRTGNNWEARRLSYVAPLVVPLCRQCHERAHNPQARKRLLQHNINLYGLEAVRQALSDLQAHLHYRLDVWGDLEEVQNDAQT